MASEILSIPEERLREVIYIIRAGMEYSQAIPLDPSWKIEMLSHKTYEILTKWCDEEEKYLDDLG